MVGIDIEETQRFLKILQTAKKRQLLKIFTEAELDYCFAKKYPHISLCGKFCAKEAFIKASNTKIPFNRIEILNKPDGSPQLYVEYKKINAQLSISHTKNYAVAIVII